MPTRTPAFPYARVPAPAIGRARGFTLIEMVVTIVLIGVLAMAVIPVISSGVKTYITTTTSINTLSKLRYATERMAREIREVRRDPVTPADYDISTNISTGSSTSLAFTKSDANQVSINGSGPPLVTLGYTLPSAVSSTLTDQVSSLTFAYYQADGSTPATSVSTVAFVEITLILIEDGALLTQRTRVALRNQL
jgi:prepilin-type N-terminal cleavage/methylation domain-containing protein